MCPKQPDGRRLEVVADGLPLFGGVQLAIDTTLVSPLRGNGSAWLGAGDRWGCFGSRQTSERTYPELVHRRHNQARLVVLAAAEFHWSSGPGTSQI